MRKKNRRFFTPGDRVRVVWEPLPWATYMLAGTVLARIPSTDQFDDQYTVKWDNYDHIEYLSPNELRRLPS